MASMTLKCHLYMGKTTKKHKWWIGGGYQQWRLTAWPCCDCTPCFGPEIQPKPLSPYPQAQHASLCEFKMLECPNGCQWRGRRSELVPHKGSCVLEVITCGREDTEDPTVYCTYMAERRFMVGVCTHTHTHTHTYSHTHVTRDNTSVRVCPYLTNSRCVTVSETSHVWCVILPVLSRVPH